MLSRLDGRRLREAIGALAQFLRREPTVLFVLQAITHPLVPPSGCLLAGSMPRPPFEPTLRRIREAGVTVVVCLVEDHEMEPESLEGLLTAYRQVGLEVVRFPVPDFGVPGDPAAFRALVLDILARLEQGSGVFVHCHAGLGRTGLVLACVLRALGLKRDPVVEVRRIYHRRAVANAWQRVFARTFAPR